MFKYEMQYFNEDIKKWVTFYYTSNKTIANSVIKNWLNDGYKLRLITNIN